VKGRGLSISVIGTQLAVGWAVMPNELHRPSVKAMLTGLLGVLAVIAAILLLRHYVPASLRSAQRLGELMRSLHAQPGGPLLTCGAFALLASAFVPVTALITGIAAVFDPPRAFMYALSGSLLSAALSRGLGQLASRPVLRHMNSPRLGTFRERLHHHTFSATVAARILPLGNFSAINLLAGALAVPWLPFLLGNVAGMAFGIAALTFLTGRMITTISAPTPANIAIVVGVLVMVAIAFFLISRSVWRRQHDS
jgi:phospholipase D1/2